MFFPYLNTSAERLIKEKSLIMAHSRFQSSSNPSSHLISYPIPHDAMMYHVAFPPFLYSCYSPLPLNIHPYLSCCLFSKHILNLLDIAQMLSPRCSFFFLLISPDLQFPPLRHIIVMAPGIAVVIG